MVIVFAKDMARMESFYCEVLGMRAAQDAERSADWVPLDSGGECTFALHAIPKPWRAGVEISDPPETRVGVPTKIVVGVSDAAGCARELAQKGVRFAAGDAPADPVTRFDILDPEGNIVQIAEA